MMRLRIVLIAAVTSLALGVIGIPAVAGASNARSASSRSSSVPPLYKLAVKGVTKNGKKFKGTYGIQRFIVTTVNHKRGVYAIGTLKGTLKGHHINRSNVLMPAALTGASGGAHTAQASCPVLHLVLGPVNLNLLGLVVTLGGGNGANLPIVLDITAVPGPGNLLGNLLCNLTRALDTGGLLSQLQGELGQLSGTLNSLLGLIGGIQAGA